MPLGYDTVYVRGRQRYEHAHRAEQALGRALPEGAQVHHVDGTKRRTSALVICQDVAYHKLLHLREKIRAAGGNPNTDKICGRCQQVKPREAFGTNPSGTFGRQGNCRLCVTAYMKARYYADPERARQRTRDYRARNR